MSKKWARIIQFVDFKSFMFNWWLWINPAKNSDVSGNSVLLIILNFQCLRKRLITTCHPQPHYQFTLSSGSRQYSTSRRVSWKSCRRKCSSLYIFVSSRALDSFSALGLSISALVWTTTIPAAALERCCSCPWRAGTTQTTSSPFPPAAALVSTSATISATWIFHLRAALKAWDVIARLLNSDRLCWPSRSRPSPSLPHLSPNRSHACRRAPHRYRSSYLLAAERCTWRECCIFCTWHWGLDWRGAISRRHSPRQASRLHFLQYLRNWRLNIEHSLFRVAAKLWSAAYRVYPSRTACHQPDGWIGRRPTSISSAVAPQSACPPQILQPQLSRHGRHH